MCWLDVIFRSAEHPAGKLHEVSIGPDQLLRGWPRPCNAGNIHLTLWQRAGFRGSVGTELRIGRQSKRSRNRSANTSPIPVGANRRHIRHVRYAGGLHRQTPHRAFLPFLGSDGLTRYSTPRHVSLPHTVQGPNDRVASLGMLTVSLNGSSSPPVSTVRFCPVSVHHTATSRRSPLRTHAPGAERPR